MFTVFVEGLELYAYHGVPAEERVIGHRYRIDLSLLVDGSATVTDDVGDTVDYSLAAKVAERVCQESQYRTVERLATQVGEALLDAFPRIVEAEVTVRKPLPPAPIIAAAVGVTVMVTRGYDGVVS